MGATALFLWSAGWPNSGVSRNSLLYLPLFCQRPAPQDGSPCQPVWKPLVCREGNGRLCPLLGCLSLPTKQMNMGSSHQGPTQTKGVSKLLSSGESRVASFQGLVWVAQKPEVVGRIASGNHPRVTQSAAAALLGIAECNALL